VTDDRLSTGIGGLDEILTAGGDADPRTGGG
jgi:hypothetical protein